MDINRISYPLEMYKILFLHKSVFINQLENLTHVVVKQEVEALHNSYLTDAAWFVTSFQQLIYFHMQLNSRLMVLEIIKLNN